MLQRIGVNNFRSADKPAADGAPGVPPPTPYELAASVRLTPEHAAIAGEIRTLENDRQAAFDEMRALIASEQNDSAIRKAAKRREKIEETLRPLRMQVRPLRDELAVRVRAALAPSRREHAGIALRALAQLAAATAYLDACEDVVGAIAGFPSFDRFQTNQGLLELRLRQIAEGAP
jgi:ElaB/YqjD/DUF883 family membrane-anchored ribosome-binding protein